MKNNLFLDDRFLEEPKTFAHLRVIVVVIVVVVVVVIIVVVVIVVVLFSMYSSNIVFVLIFYLTSF